VSKEQDLQNWDAIQQGMKFTASLDQPDTAPIAGASGEPDTATTQDDDAGMPLTTALSLLRLRQNAVLQEILGNVESQVEILEGKAKSLAIPAGNAQRFSDRAEGLKMALKAFSTNFKDATERVQAATEPERLGLNSEDARLFAQITGKQATVTVASPSFPVRYDAASAEVILANTRRAIDQMGKK
jgi:hypothetical protein